VFIIESGGEPLQALPREYLPFSVFSLGKASVHGGLPTTTPPRLNDVVRFASPSRALYLPPRWLVCADG